MDDFRIDEISKATGRSTHEVRIWVAAFAARRDRPLRCPQDYYRAINEWIAGYGVVSAPNRPEPARRTPDTPRGDLNHERC